MLNERQKKIVLDLMNSRIPVTGRQLAEKYDVSLRTIREDTGEIAAFCRQKNLNFLRVPGKGMRILSDSHDSQLFFSVLSLGSFSSLDPQERIVILFLQFLFRHQPLTFDGLSEDALVSRTTMISEIKKLNGWFTENDFSLHVRGYSNKGLYLLGSFKEKIRALRKCSSSLSQETLRRTMLEEENHLQEYPFDAEEFRDFLTDSLFLYVDHAILLSMTVHALIVDAQDNPYQMLDAGDQKNAFEKLVWWLNHTYHVSLNEEEKNILKYILISGTDYSEKAVNDEEAMQNLVDQLIQEVQETSGVLLNDKELLKADLIIHLKSSLEAQRTGLPRDNPLLDRIRAIYPDQYRLLETCVRKQKNHAGIEFTPDEIGFLTLYFLRSFEKTASINETNVMVVCNTGRSSSKLITARLLNNLPGIHVTAMGSALNLEEDQVKLKNIDLIISTIPLHHVNKPCIVVSPLLEDKELEKIKDAMWLARRTGSSEDLNALSEQMAVRTVRQNDSRRVLEGSEMNTSPNVIRLESAQLLGEITMDTFALVQKLYPQGLSSMQVNSTAGMFAHILMSVPRWQTGDLLEMKQDDFILLQKHPSESEEIREFLQKISCLLGVVLGNGEAAAILRYYEEYNG